MCPSSFFTPPSLLLTSLLSSGSAAVALLPQWRGRPGPSGEEEEEEEDDALTPPALLQVMERKEGVRKRGGRGECCRSHEWITLAQGVHVAGRVNSLCSINFMLSNAINKSVFTFICIGHAKYEPLSL